MAATAWLLSRFALAQPSQSAGQRRKDGPSGLGSEALVFNVISGYVQVVKQNENIVKFDWSFEGKPTKVILQPKGKRVAF